MIKFTSTPTVRVVSTEDLRIPVDPPVFFKVKTVIPRSVHNEIVEWETATNEDISQAKDFLARLFVAVSQNGIEWFTIAGQDGIQELWDSLEADNPGTADDFLLVLFTRFIDNHYSFFRAKA